MSESAHQDRYPGARPFADTEDDRRLFFGRAEELNALLHQLLSVNLLVLFGKSGLGKTSLLQAGLFPRLRERELLPLPVRMNRPELPCMTAFLEDIEKTCAAEDIDYTPGDTTGLWEFFKTAVFWRGDTVQTPVLVLDQFEEIFTLQRGDSRRWLARELGDVSSGRLPQRVRARLQGGETLPYSDKPPPMKVIVSLREDYLGALQELTAEAPHILDHRFRLTSLTRAQAWLAVVEPARLDTVAFATQLFTYDENAVEEMLHFLGGKTEEIEPFQLQVLCRQVEQQVQREQAGGKHDIRVTRAYLGGRQAMEGILQHFYLDAIRHLPERRLRNRARFLCEEGLLSPEGHRLSLVARHIQETYQLTPAALQILVDARLLRKEERLESFYYELSHDSLTQPVLNSRRWRMPKRVKLSLWVAGVLIALLGPSLVWTWDAYIREHVAYYNTFAKRRGVPVGVGSLTPEQVRHRTVSLKFIRHGRSRPVERVVAVDSQGECHPHHNVGTYFPRPSDQMDPLRECHWEFVYDAQERVVYEKAYNKLEQMVWGFIYSPATGDNTKASAHYVGDDGFPRPRLKSSAEFVEFTYSPDGDEILRTYFDRQHQPQPGPDGAFGVKQDFYPNGLLRKTTSLDARGLPMNDMAGNSSLQISYDALGNLVESRMLDASGQRILGKNGWYRFTAKYDTRGNLIEWAYFDTTDQPTLEKDGYHRSTAKYDARGNLIEWAYFDTTDQPTLEKDGYHRSTAKYDTRGNRIEWAYFDTMGDPTLHKDGYHRSTAMYDARGNLIELAYFDTMGDPTLHKDGYHKGTAAYDARGLRSEWAYFDTMGDPTLHKDGYHRSTAKYDARGNRIEWAYFDTMGDPTLHKDGYHRSTAMYDARGNLIESAYFDTRVQPTLHKDGYHKFTTTYDARGLLVEEVYFDLSGQPTLLKDGYHKLTAQYDACGNRIESAYFDTMGQPTLLKDGYHKLATVYDVRGQPIARAFFDTRGQPTRHKDGYHKGTVQYDMRGQPIARAFFDLSGEPTLHKDGYHKFTTTYDARGLLVEEVYFDLSGQPALHKDGYHKFTAQYDARGNLIERAYFDTRVQPTLHKDGYHKLATAYDARGQLIEMAFYGVSGESVSSHAGFKKGLSLYYPSGQPAEVIVIGLNGREGFTKMITRYDESGRATYFGAFDDQDNPAHTNQHFGAHFGFSELTTQYTSDGQVSLKCFSGFEPQWGYAQMVIRYDEKGHPVRTDYYDINGRPVETESLVITVLPDSAAERIGIHVGDVLTHYDGNPISNLDQFIIQREAEPASGQSRELRVRRNQEVLSFWILPGKMGIELRERPVSQLTGHLP